MTESDDVPFWERKALWEMTQQEWESLCDGCGLCCVHKMWEGPDGPVHYTNVACHLLDLDTCRCTRYAERHRLVPDCADFGPQNLEPLSWLPESCGYRRVFEGRPLPWWHPLVSGSAETVHEAGISLRGKAISEHDAAALEILREWRLIDDPDDARGEAD